MNLTSSCSVHTSHRSHSILFSGSSLIVPKKYLDFLEFKNNEFQSNLTCIEKNPFFCHSSINKKKKPPQFWSRYTLSCCVKFFDCLN